MIIVTFKIKAIINFKTSGYLGLQIRNLREINEKLKGMNSQDAEYNNLVATRKQIVALNPKDKHFSGGSNLLGIGVVASLFAVLDTYLGSGELFPDSHLFIGAFITGLWALAASLTPAMQKNNEIARVSHIAINSIILLLFIWQIGTGLEILQSVWTDVPWP